MINPLRRVATLVIAVIMAVFSINLVGVAQVHAQTNNKQPANNGTLKVHDIASPSGTESNEPKVCAFNFEGFGFDPSQSGYIVVSTQGGGPNSTDVLTLPFGPATQAGYAISANINDGVSGYTVPNDMYKATLYGKDTNNPGQPNLQDEKAKSKVFKVECIAPTPKVTPVAPIKTDLCMTANDTYTIPATTGITYRANGVVKAAGTYAGNGLVIITASANAGYILQGTASWTFLFTALPCAVIPAEPTKNDVCGMQNDTYTIPATTGVRYFVNGTEKPAGTYAAPNAALIVAVAKPGYVIDIHAQAIWVFAYTNKKCPQPCHTATLQPFMTFDNWKIDADDCIPVEVTTATPTKRDVCDTINDIYTIPSTTGVIYKVNGVIKAAGTYKATGTVVITAEAADSGYVIAQGQTTTWTFIFDAVACPQADITVTALCSPQGVIVTLVNKGDADGSVSVNGDEVIVPADDTVEVTVPMTLYKASVEVISGDTEATLLDQAFDCTPGQGSAGGETPIVPPVRKISATLPAADLPVTGSDSLRQVMMIAVIGVTVYGLTYFLQGRRKLSRTE